MKMKFRVVSRWLSGLCVLVLKMEGSSASFTCEDKTIEGEPETLCTITSTTTVPAYIGPIKNKILVYIIIVADPSTTMIAYDPLNYPSLTEFYIFMQSGSFSAPENFFSLLNNLKILGLVMNEFAVDKVPDLPPSITEFRVLGYQGKPLKLSKLSNLEDLSYASSELKEFPSLPNTAPIKKLNFNDSGLELLNLTDIAQYCLLKDIQLEETNIDWGSYIKYCEFSAFFERHNITYKMSTKNSPNLNYDEYFCRSFGVKVDLKNEDAEAKYEKCLERVQGFNKRKWTYILIIFLGVALTVLTNIIVHFIWSYLV